MVDKDGKYISLTRNTISGIGVLIAFLAVANLLFLLLTQLGSEHDAPYLGLLIWIVFPAILLCGLALFVLGVLLERRRRRRMAPDQVSGYPRLDLNVPRTRRIFLLAILGITIFAGISMVGTYHAYHFTDSDQFCGTTCHEPMHPEYTAYKASPHARVGCVNCHIGSGATWYVKSKLSGARQVWATLASEYPRPIPSPVHNLRPAQETCEQCHWPEKFWGAQLKVFNHFGYDEANTPRETRMLIKVGGGSPATGATSGIHWHMNLENEVTYIATDDQRQKIEWVQMRNRRTGATRQYLMEGSKLTPAQIASSPKRTMDCVDCHNRPTHIYPPPDRAVDKALLAHNLARNLPYIKQQAVTVLSKDFTSTAQALAAIEKEIGDYYRTNHPAVYASQRKDVDRSIAALKQIFQTTRFPEMKVDWRTHPDNIGHFYSAGCFRCHDDQHKASDGRAITKECRVCHDVLGQKEAGVAMIEAPDAPFVHPVDLGDLREMTCNECHTGKEM